MCINMSQKEVSSVPMYKLPIENSVIDENDLEHLTVEFDLDFDFIAEIG